METKHEIDAIWECVKRVKLMGERSVSLEGVSREVVDALLSRVRAEFVGCRDVVVTHFYCEVSPSGVPGLSSPPTFACTSSPDYETFDSCKGSREVDESLAGEKGVVERCLPNWLFRSFCTDGCGKRYEFMSVGEAMEKARKSSCRRIRSFGSYARARLPERGLFRWDSDRTYNPDDYAGDPTEQSLWDAGLADYEGERLMEVSCDHLRFYAVHTLSFYDRPSREY